MRAALALLRGLTLGGSARTCLGWGRRRDPAMTPTALRRSALVLLTALLATLLTAPAAQARPLRDRLPLPDGFQPEGIAISGDHAYFGSRADRRDLQPPTSAPARGRVLSKAVGSPSLGMKVDGTRPAVRRRRHGRRRPGRRHPHRQGAADLPVHRRATDVRQRRGADPAGGLLHRLEQRRALPCPARPARWPARTQRPGRLADRARGSRPRASTRTASPAPRTAGRCSSCSPRPASCSGSTRRPASRGGSDLGGTLLTDGDGLLVHAPHPVRRPEPAQPGRRRAPRPGRHSAAGWWTGSPRRTSTCPPRWPARAGRSTCRTPGSARRRPRPRRTPPSGSPADPVGRDVGS